LPSPKRILAVRLSALGDLILAQSAILTLSDALPDAEITWVIDQRFADLAADVPGVRVIGIAKPRSLGDYLRFWKMIRRESYDVLLAMQANLRVNLLYAGIRTPRKIGFDARRARDLHRFFVNETIPRRDEHLLDGFRQFAGALGADLTQPPRWPAWSAESVQAWWQHLALPKPYVVIHTGASKPERCWPAHRYAALAARFAAQPSLQAVLTGGTSPEENAAAEAFKAVCPHALDLCGKTQLKQLRQVLQQAAVVVSPDTAAVHLARLENVPVIGLYAVARAELSGPYQELRYTLNLYPDAVRQLAHRDPTKTDWHFRVHHPEAMALIEEPAVWAKIEQALRDRDHRA